MRPNEIERYARHLVLKEIGGPGQQALLKSRVLVIGAGGLGGPAGLYLAAAGIGYLEVLDDDAVDLSNLQRQIQFSETDIGKDKSSAMARRLKDINPDISISFKNQRLNEKNAQDLIKSFDVVLDGTDNFETRFLVNQASFATQTPLISGAIGRFDGQVSIFNTNDQSPCYQCLVPAIPPQAQTCSEVGVVGALAGIIGSMMALETIKHITGTGNTLNGRVWLFDGMRGESRTISLPKDPACPVCAQSKAKISKADADI